MSKITHLSKECPLCGGEFVGKGKYCERCSVLHSLLGSGWMLDDLVGALWDHCFACEAEIIATVNLTPESLIIQCDNCGEVHVIPFTTADILQYIRGGIVREMVADE